MRVGADALTLSLFEEKFNRLSPRIQVSICSRPLRGCRARVQTCSREPPSRRVYPSVRAWRWLKSRYPSAASKTVVERARIRVLRNLVFADATICRSRKHSSWRAAKKRGPFGPLFCFAVTDRTILPDVAGELVRNDATELSCDTCACVVMEHRADHRQTEERTCHWVSYAIQRRGL